MSFSDVLHPKMFTERAIWVSKVKKTVFCCMVENGRFGSFAETRVTYSYPRATGPHFGSILKTVKSSLTLMEIPYSIGL
jgi:hypothetical protein